MAKKQIRAKLRKNRAARPRKTDWTRRFAEDEEGLADEVAVERISGKGELTRKRTVTLSRDEASNSAVDSDLIKGRVLRVDGLISWVAEPQGEVHPCAVRRVLKSLETDARHVVVVGDFVQFRLSSEGEGVIEHVEPRQGILHRTSRGKQHVLVANVDQVVIVASAAEPYLKPNLIDRYLLVADNEAIQPLICINKIDLVDPAELLHTCGVYAQMGYEVLLVSASTMWGIGHLRSRLADRVSVFAGQSGVGKSSLLNAVDSQFKLDTGDISSANRKGRHTTTSAQLLRLQIGGYVVDTPGIRQFHLWDIIPEEVAGLFRDLRSYVSLCHFPDCTHLHEDGCAVRAAVRDGCLDERRYASYTHIVESQKS